MQLAYGVDAQGGGGKIQKTLNFNKMWIGPFVGILDLLYGGHLALLLVTHGNHSVVRRIGNLKVGA